MKKAVFLLMILFSSMCLNSCTNDEGNDDIDLLTPDDENESTKDIVLPK